MDARTRLKREIIRRRRRWPHPWPPEIFTRITTPNGTPVQVVIRRRACTLHTAHADYRVTCGTTYGPWPATPELLRDLGLWA